MKKEVFYGKLSNGDVSNCSELNLYSENIIRFLNLFYNKHKDYINFDKDTTAKFVEAGFIINETDYNNDLYDMENIVVTINDNENSAMNSSGKQNAINRYPAKTSLKYDISYLGDQLNFNAVKLNNTKVVDGIGEVVKLASQILRLNVSVKEKDLILDYLNSLNDILIKEAHLEEHDYDNSIDHDEVYLFSFDLIKALNSILDKYKRTVIANNNAAIQSLQAELKLKGLID